ncbi:MAG: ABC transporter substrate-binding protein [Blautia sp.]|jgi:raffinose/stachyose/melibiose transport system substrate-binding protein
MKRKLLGVLLSVTMVASMLVGCGGGGDDKAADTKTEDTKAEDTAKDDAAADDTKDDAAGDTAASGDGLVYWSMWESGEAQAIAIQKVLDAYTEETGIPVEVQWKGRDINKVIAAALEAGEKIDLFDEDYQRVGEQYADLCMDLEDMAKAADYENHAVAAFPTAMRGWAGSLKGIAYQAYTSGIFYNKAIFEEAGVEKEPQTWAEFLDVCQKIKDAGYAPLALDDAYAVYNYGYQIARYMGEDAVKELTMNGGWADNEQAKKATQDIVDFLAAGYLSEDAPGAYPENENTIGYDETAMIVNASWVPAEITNQTQCDIQWGMFNYPSVDGGKDPNTVANVGAQAFAIPKYSEKGQEAFDLIMKIATGEGDQAIALETNSIPADPTNEEWPEIIAGCKDAFNALTGVYEWNCGLNKNQNIKEELNTNILKLFEGEYDTDGFLKAMDGLY